MAGTYDIELTRGDYLARTFTFTSEDLVTGGNPTGTVDWTGCTVAAQVRKTGKSPIVICDLAAAFSGTPADGTISIVIEEDAVPAGTLAWDLQVTDTAGHVQTWLAGAVLVKQDVTRA